MKNSSKPKELELTELEERLVSPRIPFMQLREKPRGGQLSINGNVVNVPADVTSTVKKLPRMMSENETIALNFKRSLSFKHSVASERIRPNKVFVAAKWLVENSALYKSEGIEVNQSWVHSLNSEESNITETSSLGNIDLNTSVNNSAGESSLRKSQNEIDSWTEDPDLDDRPSGNTDTVLQSVDFREFNEVLNVAPGKHNNPLCFRIFSLSFWHFLLYIVEKLGQTTSLVKYLCITVPSANVN